MTSSVRTSESDPVGDRERRSDRAAIAVGATAGAVLVAVLAAPRLGAAPLWLDEAYSLGVTNQFFEGVRRSGGTMVSYYALLWGWTRVGDSPGWIRLLSTLLAMVAMVPVAAVGRRIGGRRLAVLAPLLLAGASMFQYAATEARAYSLEIIIVTSCWYLLIRAVDPDSDTTAAKRCWTGLAILAPIGVLTHGLFVLFVGAMIVAALLGPGPVRSLRAMVPMFVTTAITTGILGLLGIADVGSWIEPTRFVVVKHAINNYLGGYGIRWLVTIAAFLGLTVWIVVNRVRSLVARRGGDEGSPHLGEPEQQRQVWLATVPVVWMTVPPVLLIGVSVVSPRFVDRYVVAITPAVALVIGLGVCRAVDWATRRIRLGGGVATVVVGLIGVGLVAGWVHHGQVELNHRRTAGWDVIARTVADRARPGDAIAFYSDQSRPPFEAAWARIPHRVVPEVVTMPRPLGEVRRYDDLVDTYEEAQRRIETFDRVWTITISDREINAVYYELGGVLPEKYRVVDSWPVDVLTGDATLRLYVRDGADD